MKNKNFITIFGISLILFVVLMTVVISFFKTPKEVKLEKLDDFKWLNIFDRYSVIYIIYLIVMK